MSPKRKRAIWPADPHTLAKIELVRRYLEAWLTIMGRGFPGSPILYIDGFAGPGIYSKGEDGSPIAALKAATKAISIASTNWRAGNAHIALVEKDKDFARSLREQAALVRLHPRVTYSIREGSFAEQLEELRALHRSAFQDGNPLFAFVDPFGVKGVLFSSIEAIMSSTASEVFVNFDVDGIHRVFSDLTPTNEAILDGLFGDSDWRAELQTGHHQDFYRRVWTAYRRRLNRIGVRYTYPFMMKGQDDQVLYYLVFGSRHKLGIIKMKEAMASVGQHKTLSVSDALNGRQALFDLDDPEFYLPALQQHFGGREGVPIDEVEDYVLIETQFRSLSRILTPLVERGLVRKNPPTSRKNVFKGVTSLDFM